MKRTQGQNLIEYCIFIFCLVAALIAMQVYIKRAVQGQLRRSADDVGEQFDAKATSSNIIYSVTGKSSTSTWLTRDTDGDGDDDDNNGDGEINDRDYISVTLTNIDPNDSPETTIRSGTEDIGAFGGLYD